MSYFFFLPHPFLESFCTLSNFPPRYRHSDWSLEQIVHLCWSNGEKWIVKDLYALQPGESKKIWLHEFTELTDNKSMFVFLHPECKSGVYDQFVSFDHMETSPAWRANIGLKSDLTASSYQGEYPVSMVNRTQGSLVSCSPFVQTGDGISNSIYFVSIRSNPEITVHQILFKDDTKNIVGVSDICSNTVNYIDLNNLNFSENRMIMAVTDDILGIPIYFVTNSDFSEMSLEHTHPPMESVVHGNRIYFHNRKKKHWLTKLDKKNS